MGISKKLFLVLLPALLLPLFSHAQVQINEIMYDLSGTDTGREWIEIYNSGSNAVDLSSWKFFENNTNHGLNSISGGTNLTAGGYAVTTDDSTKFLLDWPNFSGILFDSTFSLNNTGETISLKDDAQTVVDEVTYQSSIGANGDGNSLQKSGSTWIAAIPTPGLANATESSTAIVATTTATTTAETATSSSSSNQGSSSSGSSSAHYSAAPLSNLKIVPGFEVSAGRDRLGTVGSPLEFKVETNIEYTNNSIFVWNFGDGREGGGEVVSHTYMYPGEYVLILNVAGPRGKAVSRVNIKIASPELAITNVSREKIEITNNSKSEASLFGRALVTRDKIFAFPRDTIIKAGQKISFGANVTGLDVSGQSSVSLVVVGTEIRPREVIAKMEEEKQEEIKRISTELNILRDTLVRLEAEESSSNLAQEPIQNPAAVTGEVQNPIENNKSQTALVLESVDAEGPVKSNGWLQTLKRFFFRTRE